MMELKATEDLYGACPSIPITIDDVTIGLMARVAQQLLLGLMARVAQQTPLGLCMEELHLILFYS